MRVAKLIVASCLLAVSSAGVASAQFVDPLRVLEASRRDRLEMDIRLAREAAARRQKEKADQAAQAAAQRKLEKEKAALANSAPTQNAPAIQLGASSASAASATLDANQPGALSAREIAPGTPIPAASPANTAPASDMVASTQPETSSPRDVVPDPRISTASPVSAASASPDTHQPGKSSAPQPVTGVALPPSPPIDPPNGMPLSTQTGAPSGQGIGSATPIPTAPASSATSETPATNQPAAPLARDAVVDTPAPVPTRVLITVDKAAQRMRVTVDGKLRHSWAVSTGRVHYETPTGTFRPLYLAKVHYSKEWDDAPMPHSIFFTDRGHAIHASNATRSLGRRASHGCVRLAPSKAATLFALVRAEGVSATKVLITNGTSAGKAARSRTADGSARRRTHVRRAFSDPWQIGSGDRWAE
jgi:lipoprotein-anchoring transpeptidase ErfK/SrfK